MPNFVHAPSHRCTSQGMEEGGQVHVYTLASLACLMYSNSDIWTRIKILHEMRVVLRAVIICFVAAPALLPSTPSLLFIVRGIKVAFIYRH